MTRYYFLIFLLSISFYSNAQLSDSLLTKSEFHVEFSRLINKLKVFEKSNFELQILNAKQKKEIDSIANQLSISQTNVQRIADSLHININNISAETYQTQGQIRGINQAIVNRTILWIIGILLALLLSLIVYLTLRKRLLYDTNNIEGEMQKINFSIQSEAFKLDTKLVDVLQAQLTIIKDQKAADRRIENNMDHKLPLKVGEEIHRMKKRIENMPQDIKGLNALSNSLQRLEEQFNENGYEIEELVGRRYVDGMKVEARFVDNPNIPKGEEIITDVLRPQIMYNGTLIQVAKVEVGKSY